jgi:hypothetical protein
MNKPVKPTGELFDGAEPVIAGRALAVVPTRPKPDAEAKPDAKPRKSDDFDWHDDDSIILRHQPAVAIYFNDTGGLVIRQERDWCEERDTCVIIAESNTQKFLDKLCDTLGIGSIG